jgi:glycerate 2-kinase
MQEIRETLRLAWMEGVRAAGGHAGVLRALVDQGIARPDRILAVGKAAVAMAEAALAHFDEAIPTLAVTKHGHGGRALAQEMPIETIEAGHPIPDEGSLAGGAALLAAVREMGAGSRLLLLVSGGASALAEAPAPGLSLEVLREKNRALIAGGLDIHAINAQRRAFSRIKGGGLLANFSGAHADVLAISDVEGDDIGVIGSGIGLCPPDAQFSCMSRIVASNRIAREAAAALLEQAGHRVRIEGETLHGDVRAVASRVGAQLREMPAGAAVLGGEPTVVLPENPGKGGRNQSLALELAREIVGQEGLCLLVAGTDGTDGPTDAAGGYADGLSWNSLGQGQDHLDRADAGTWLDRAGLLFSPGPTGTNVMDLLVAVKRA